MADILDRIPAVVKRNKPGGKQRKAVFKIIFRNAALFSILISLLTLSVALAQGLYKYYWAGSLLDQFDSLPNEDYRRHDSEALAFTYWQGGTSFIGEDPETYMHVQGIARYDVGGTPYFFFSRNGNPWTLGTDHPGELVVVRMDSHSGSDGEELGETCSEIDSGDCKPYLNNTTVHNVIFTNDIVPPDEFGAQLGWKHGGGMQVYDHFLFVPLEKTCSTVEDPDYPTDEKYQYYCAGSEANRGAIAVFDLSHLDTCPSAGCMPFVTIITQFYTTDPETTQNLPTMGAIGVTEYDTGSGTELLFVHSAGDMNNWTFLTAPTIYGPYQYLDTAHIDEKYAQTANFVYSTPDDTLYLVMTRSGSAEPGGTDYADIYEVNPTPSLTRIQELHIYLETEDGLDIGDFTAAGGIYASPTGRLMLYSGHFDNNGWDLSSSDSCSNPAHTQLCTAYQFGELVSDFGSAPVVSLSDQTAVNNVYKSFNLGSFTDDFCAAGFQVRIDWGDSSPVTNQTITTLPPYTIQAGHTFYIEGIHDGSVEVMDCEGMAGRGTFQTTVYDINDPPSGTNASYTLSENSSHTFLASNFGFQDPSDSPADNFLSVRITTLPAAGSLTLSGSPVTTGQEITTANIPNLAFTPAADANGNPYTSFTFQVRDDGGTANGGVDLDPTPNTLTFNVTAVNGEPSFTSGGNVTVLEDSAAYSAAWATDIDDGDPELTQTLSFVVASNSNSSLFSTGPSVSSDGTLSFTPAADANGSATIGLELHDNGGSAGSNDDTYGPINFTITVTAVNDEPSFTSGGNVSVLENSGAYSAAWATGIDDGDPEATQTLNFVVTSNSNPSLFSTAPAVASNGTLSFTLAADTSGSAAIGLELRDNGGTTNGGDNTYGPISFTINVSYVNTEPIFTSGGDITVAEDSGPWSGTWATDIDDGDPEMNQDIWFTTQVTSNPGLLTSIPALMDNGTLLFTPASNAAGTATISVTLRDDGGTANGGDDSYGPVSFDIIITPVNDAPTNITLDNNTIAENEPAGTVVGSLATTDPDAGDSHTYSLVTGVSGCDSSGNASFQISGSELQSDEVFEYEGSTTSYEVCVQTEDGEGDTYAKQFNVTVTNVNEAPVNSVPALQNTNDGMELTFSTADSNLISVSDVDAGSLDMSISLSVAHGTLTLGDSAGLVFSIGDGTNDAALTFNGSLSFINAALEGLVYTPDTGFAGIDTLTITSDDEGHTGSGGAQTDTDAVSITVSVLPPTILTSDIDSIPGTADGVLTPDETLRSLTQILVRFSELMDETTPGDEVTNPLNYLLIFGGSDGTFQTGTCDDVKNGVGVDPADLSIPITDVTYNDITSTATLTFGSTLGNGWYRLYVCGSATLRDLTGAALAGDGANMGTDYTLDFRIRRNTGGGGDDDIVLGLLIPATGFAPGRVTPLPVQPSSSRYADAGLTLSIPTLGVSMPIVGVPLVEDSWDITWLGRSAGWLEGSAFPTSSGNTVLTGHVWDASNLPGPFVGLKDLRFGDRFEIRAFGLTYTYEVRANTLLMPWQVNSAFRHEEYDWVTLLTCEDFNHAADNYLYRRAVRAVLISIE
ncbi:MAG: sortase [Anaerolineales bacterium]|nr:sortase [Anaerolineales bacterium]